MCWKLHKSYKYAIKNMHTLPVYALNLIFFFWAAPETHFKSILMFEAANSTFVG